MREPKVGDPVHYVSFGTPGGEYHSRCRAATITEVRPPTVRQGVSIEASAVGLAVVNPTGLFFHPIAHENGPCPHSEDEHKGGTWHWPEESNDG